MSGSCLGMLLSMQCCWSLSPPVTNGFLNVAGECGRAKRDLPLRGGSAETGGIENVPAAKQMEGLRPVKGAPQAASGCYTGGHALQALQLQLHTTLAQPVWHAHLTASACCLCWGRPPGSCRSTGSGWAGWWPLTSPPGLKGGGDECTRIF